MIAVGEGSYGLGENPFPEGEMPTMRSLLPMRIRVLHRPGNQTNCGMQHMSELRTGRHLEGQTPDSGVLESAEGSPYRLFGPSEK